MEVKSTQKGVEIPRRKEKEMKKNVKFYQMSNADSSSSETLVRLNVVRIEMI